MKKIYILFVFLVIYLLNCSVIAAPEWLNNAEVYVNDQLIGHYNQHETTYPDPILVKINDKIKARVQVNGEDCIGNLTIEDANYKKTDFKIPENTNPYKQVTFYAGNWGNTEKHLWMNFRTCHGASWVYWGDFKLLYN